MSRAYISPEKPRLEANLRVSPGFLPVFWNSERLGSEAWYLYIVPADCDDPIMRFVYADRAQLCQRPVTEVLGTVRRY